MGDVAQQTKARYCTEYYNVNAGATSIESGSSYPGRSDAMLAKGETQPEAATVAAMQYGIIRSQPRP